MSNNPAPLKPESHPSLAANGSSLNPPPRSTVMNPLPAGQPQPSAAVKGGRMNGWSETGMEGSLRPVLL